MHIDRSGEKIAYLISLDYINCEDMTTGRDYKRFEQNTNNVVKFGKDDVYVYDSTGSVFYAKGFKYESVTYYEQIQEADNIRIIDVKKEKVDNKTKVTITIESDKEVDYVLLKNGSYEVKNNNNKGPGKVTYELIVEKNGKYEITVKDKAGNTVKETFTITSAESSVKPTVTTRVTNGVESGGVYQVQGNTVKLEIDSNTAKYLYISKESSQPTSWLPYTTNLDKYYSTAGEKTLYVWVKDENNNVCDNPAVLKVNIILNEINKPVVPDEDFSGEIEFTVSHCNEWKRSKKVTIEFKEILPSDKYQFLYHVDTGSGLSSNNNWTVSYENKVELDINRNGTNVTAKIVYNSPYNKGVTVRELSIEINKIDTKSPTLTSLKVVRDNDNRTYIEGSATDGTNEDNDSGIPTLAYLLSTKQINFKYLTDETINNDYSWQEISKIEISKDAKYYYYVRDNANNVGYGVINAESADKIAPEIKSISTTRVLNYVDVEIIAEDNMGVTGFAVVKGSSTESPTEWQTIQEDSPVILYRKNIKENGEYTVWVTDRAGNTTSKTINIILGKLPVLDANYPQNIYIAAGNTGAFEVVFSAIGEPDEYEYQWKYSNDNGVTWQNIAGAISKKYSFVAEYKDNNNLYKCEIKHVAGKIESGVARLQVANITNTSPELIVTPDKEMVAGGIIINEGADKTSNLNLSIEIVAINATQVSISETDTKGVWQDYNGNTKHSYTLSNTTEGVKTINVWIKDDNGNEEKMTAQIEYRK